MALKRPHSDWRLEAVSPIDVRAVGLDQVLTQLWLRINNDNRPLMPRAGVPTRVVELANEMERRNNEQFVGFGENHGAAETWLRADLVRTLRRKPEIFTVARPVHLLATRVRSSDRHADDSHASLAVYAWMDTVEPTLKAELGQFIDVDPEDESLDLATDALAILGEEREADTRRTNTRSPTPTPLCRGQARTYADDVRRLLAYRQAMPRTALLEHLRRLTGFHLGLYLLRVFRIVVEAEQTGGRTTACQSCAAGRTPRSRVCPHRLDLIVDCGEDARAAVAKIAEQSWALQEDQLARYVRSHLTLKKLHEFASYLQEKRPDEAVPFSTIHEIAAVEKSARPEILDLFFDQRIDSTKEQSDPAVAARIDELEATYRKLGLSSFRAYIAILAHFSERRWVNYHRYLLDSLFSKNTSEGVLRQPLGGKRRRRGALGPALLETLTLISVVHGDAGAYYTRPLRVDQLIDRLENRYDLLIAHPPQVLRDDLEVARELAANVDRFKARLRETGLFTDLSDAFLAQLVKPRYHLTQAS